MSVRSAQYLSPDRLYSICHPSDISLRMCFHMSLHWRCYHHQRIQMEFSNPIDCSEAHHHDSCGWRGCGVGCRRFRGSRISSGQCISRTIRCRYCCVLTAPSVDSSIAAKRQAEALSCRRIDLSSSALEKLRGYDTDSSKLQLGFLAFEYTWLAQNGTHIVHNEWPTSATRPLNGFEV